MWRKCLRCSPDTSARQHIGALAKSSFQYVWVLNRVWNLYDCIVCSVCCLELSARKKSRLHKKKKKRKEIWPFAATNRRHLKENYVVLGKTFWRNIFFLCLSKPNKQTLCFYAWINWIYCCHLADPATFLASNSVSWEFTLRTACLFSYGNHTYFLNLHYDLVNTGSVKMLSLNILLQIHTVPF